MPAQDQLLDDRFFTERSDYLAKMKITSEKWASQNIPSVEEQNRFVESSLEAIEDMFDEVWSRVN